MNTHIVHVTTPAVTKDEEEFSEVEIDIIGTYRFTGEDHEDMGLTMAEELEAILCKYRDFEVR